MFFVVLWIAPERNFAVAVATNVGTTEPSAACDQVAVAMIHQYLPK
jgi:hypothetical protein